MQSEEDAASYLPTKNMFFFTLFKIVSRESIVRVRARRVFVQRGEVPAVKDLLCIGLFLSFVYRCMCISASLEPLQTGARLKSRAQNIYTSYKYTLECACCICMYVLLQSNGHTPASTALPMCRWTSCKDPSIYTEKRVSGGDTGSNEGSTAV